MRPTARRRLFLACGPLWLRGAAEGWDERPEWDALLQRGATAAHASDLLRAIPQTTARNCCR